MVKVHETETGYYEYVDEQGNKRIGKWYQEYQGDRDYYGGEIMNRKKVGVVDFTQDSDDDYVDGEPDTKKECPHCLEYNSHVKLQGRILKKGEEKPPDYDQFLQCHSCGAIVPAHEGILESKIEESLETIDNPFQSKFEVVGIAKRTSKQGRKDAAKRRKEKNRQHMANSRCIPNL
jgi:hypothetical protein